MIYIHKDKVFQDSFSKYVSQFHFILYFQLEIQKPASDVKERIPLCDR